MLFRSGKRNAEIDEALGKLTIEALTQETLTLRNAYTLMVSEKWGIPQNRIAALSGKNSHNTVAFSFFNGIINSIQNLKQQRT